MKATAVRKYRLAGASPLSLLIFILFLAISTGAPLNADERISIELKINDEVVHFIYDTGAEHSCIFRTAAERLKLKVVMTKSGALHPGEVHIDHTEPFSLVFAGKPHTVSLPVLDGFLNMPAFDGIIGWKDLTELDGNVMLIDAGANTASSVPVPDNIKSWTPWKIDAAMGRLMIECDDGERLGIDTGSEGGVYLNPSRWQKWRARRSGQPATIDAFWTLDHLLHVADVLQARTITLGGLTLHDVPVSVSDSPSDALGFKGFDAIMGLYTFHQMKVTIDQKHGLLYTLPISGAPPPYDYNRLGAVFVPQDPTRSNDLIGHVAAGGPADNAGIKNGDVLEKINDLDVTKWRTDPKVLPLSRFWSQPSGTSLHLFLTRDGHAYDVSVTLKDPAPVD